MTRLTLGRKIGAGFLALVLLVLVICAVALASLRQVATSHDRLVTIYARNLQDGQILATLVERRLAINRAYVLTGRSSFLDARRQVRAEYQETWERLRKNVVHPRAMALLPRIDAADRTQRAAADRMVERRSAGESVAAVVRLLETEVLPGAEALSAALAEFARVEESIMEDAKAENARLTSRATGALAALAAVAAALAIGISLALTRSLAGQIGSAVMDLQSSSAELQAAASQQAASSTAEASTLVEVAATLKELVGSSRQIADSAQRVARLAESSTAATRAGDRALQQTQEVMAGIKRQMDLISTHIVELSRKSQQVGIILGIITELAEQTNILAINAGIESAGAGEPGRRFGAISAEIRQLADRVGAQAQESRALVEDVRGAAGTAVIVTEEGVKAVDAGARLIPDVTGAFRQIAGQVGDTAEAAREIELSTKQQTSAVEQVDSAIASTAQAAQETEASTRQTVATATILAGLSATLGRMVSGGDHAGEPGSGPRR